MSKRIEGTFGFTVDDAAVEYVENITGAMFVQIDENVVEHDDSLNERSIVTTGVEIDHTVNDATQEQTLRHYVMRKMMRNAFTDAELEEVREYLRTYGPETEDGLAQALVEKFPEQAHEVLDEMMAGETDKDALELASREEHRATMRRYMHNAHQEIAGLLHYWTTNDLHGAFLSGPEYPFTQSLEEVESAVGQAALVLGQPLVVNDPIMRIWDGMTDDEIDEAVKAAEAIDGLGRWHYAGQPLGAACGAGEDKLTTGDIDKVSCTACKRLIAEDEDGEFQGELAPYTPMLNLLLEGNDYDAEVWENGNLLLLVLDANQGTALGIADYVDVNWSVCLYVQHDNFKFTFEDVDTDENYLDITESVGHVPASNDPETQVELARRILFYLKSEQHKIDVNTLTQKMEKK